MRYKSCEFINHSLCFNDNRILYCTVGNQSNCKQYAVIQENYNGEKINWENLLEKIFRDKTSFKNGHIIKSCENCFMLTENDWDKEAPVGKFKYVLFSNWNECNSACRYCWRDGKDFLIEDVEKISKINPDNTYDILPVLKDITEKNLLTDDAVIDFAGGEPTMYYKFDEALKYLLTTNIKKIVIHTNAIIYSEQIEQAVKNGVADVLISIDAGRKETHQKIKRVVSFDRVWQNLEKYCKALQKNNKNKVRSKFIIVPDYNDNKEEILLWIKKSIKTGVSELVLNADDCVYMEKELNMKHIQKIKFLTDYFIKTAKEMNFRYQLYTNSLNSYLLLGCEKPNNIG